MTRNGAWLEFSTSTPTQDLHRLTGWAVEAGLELDHLEVNRPSLEDVYLDIVGHEDGDGA